MHDTTHFQDSQIIEDSTRVRVCRHEVDWKDLDLLTAQRAEEILSLDNPPRCVYLNPWFTVICSEPTADFLHEIRKRQAEWCRQASNTFRPKVRRKVSNWIGAGGQVFNSKSARYFDRCLCFTGILFIDGKIVYPGKWDLLVRSNSKQKSINRVRTICLG